MDLQSRRAADRFLIKRLWRIISAGKGAKAMDKYTGRQESMEYPDYSAEIDAIDRGGITPELLERIIRRHQG